MDSLEVRLGNPFSKAMNSFLHIQAAVLLKCYSELSKFPLHSPAETSSLSRLLLTKLRRNWKVLSLLLFAGTPDKASVRHSVFAIPSVRRGATSQARVIRRRSRLDARTSGDDDICLEVFSEGSEEE